LAKLVEVRPVPDACREDALDASFRFTRGQVDEALTSCQVISFSQTEGNSRELDAAGCCDEFGVWGQRNIPSQLPGESLSGVAAASRQHKPRGGSSDQVMKLLLAGENFARKAR